MNKICAIIFLLTIMLCGVPGWSAEPLRCRIGWLVSEEISTQQPSGNIQIDPMAYPEKYANKAYAIVALKLDPERGLSIYDFSLRYNGRRFPCVALRKGSSDFDTAQWSLNQTVPEELFSLLFILDYPDLSNAGSEITLELLYNLSNNPSPLTMEIKFKNLGSNSFTSVADILAALEKKPEPPPDKPAATVSLPPGK